MSETKQEKTHSASERAAIAALDELDGYAPWLAVVRTYALCQRLLSHRLEKVGLSVAQLDVLIAIARHDGCTQKALASRLLVTKSNVTAMLERMERSGWVRRLSHPADGRQRRVHLSANGRAALEAGVAEQARVVRLMTDDFSEADYARLHTIMRDVGARLRATLESEHDE